MSKPIAAKTVSKTITHSLPLLLLGLAAAFPYSVSAATAVPSTAPDESQGLSFGTRHTLHSKVLEHDEDVWIYTPPGYADSASNPRVPVVYFPDAGRHFLHLAGLIDFLSEDARQIPPMVVVGIANRWDDRENELAPTFSTARTAGGGAEKLYEFIHDEVIPYVEARYRTAPFRILSGQSLGGLFAINVLRKHPETFDAIIASSPSLWWDDRIVLRNPGSWGRSGQFLFLTVESPDREFSHQSAIKEFAGQLRDHAVPGLKWAFKGYPAEWHGSVYHRSFYDGLQFVFPDWNFQLAADMSGEVTYAQLVEHYAKLSRRYGYDIPVSLATVRAVAIDLCAQKRLQDAVSLCAARVERFPASSESHALLASVQLRAGNLAAARAEYEKTLALDPRNTAARRALEELSSADQPEIPQAR